MIFTPELLSQLEQNNELKKSYASQGSFGQNRLIALPVILGFFAAFGAYEFYDLSKADPDYKTFAIICALVVVACLVAVVFMQKSAKKGVMENLDDVKVCIAKKIAGNDSTEVYYSIYTVGSKRHDTEFIESVAYKIFNADLVENDQKLRAKINDLFKPNLEGMNATPVLLPVEFTFGEEVYKKEFKFASIDGQMKANIVENEERFIVLSFNNRSVIPIQKV